MPMIPGNPEGIGRPHDIAIELGIVPPRGGKVLGWEDLLDACVAAYWRKRGMPDMAARRAS